MQEPLLPALGSVVMLAVVLGGRRLGINARADLRCNLLRRKLCNHLRRASRLFIFALQKDTIGCTAQKRRKRFLFFDVPASHICAAAGLHMLRTEPACIPK